MVINWRALLENPAALVGVIRALAILVLGFGASWFTEGDVENAVSLVTQLSALLSILLSGVSTVATRNQIRSARGVTAPAEDV